VYFNQAGQTREYFTPAGNVVWSSKQSDYNSRKSNYKMFVYEIKVCFKLQQLRGAALVNAAK